MSIEALNYAINAKVSHVAWSVLIVLSYRANKDMECWPKIESIQESTKLSRSAIFKGLKELEDLNIIQRKKRKFESLFTINVDVLEELKTSTTETSTTETSTTETSTTETSTTETKTSTTETKTSTTETSNPFYLYKKGQERSEKDHSFAPSDSPNPTPPESSSSPADIPDTDTGIDQDDGQTTQSPSSGFSSPPSSEDPPLKAKSKAKAKAKEEDEPLTPYWLPLESGEQWFFTQPYFDLLLSMYPSVDVVAEIRKMYMWLDANPTNRKTKRGIKRFITSWLSRCVDSRRGTAGTITKPQYTNKNTGTLDQIQQIKELEEECNND